MVYSEFIPSRETAITLHELARAIPGGVVLDGGSNVSNADSDLRARSRDDWIRSRFRAFAGLLHSPVDDDRFDAIVTSGVTSGFNTARQFKGNESFVKFQGASHAVIYSDLRPRQKFLRSCDMITLTVDGASEEK